MTDSPDRTPGDHGRRRGLVWWVGWPVRQVLIALVVGYQRLVSPMLAPSCRYHPVCSAYALKAIRRHGAAKGGALALWRIIRCNPWSRGGLDPVPRRGRWRPDILPDGTPRRPPESA